MTFIQLRPFATQSSIDFLDTSACHI